MERGKIESQVQDKVLEIVSKYKSFFKICVLYHGGEPLLSPDLINLIKSIKSILKDGFIKTVSNGMLLTESKAKEIADSVLDYIEFSLDSFSAEESNKIRRNSNAELVIARVNKLIEIIKETKSQLKVSISSTQFWSLDLEINPLKELPETPPWLKTEFNNIESFKTCWAMKWPD